MGKDDLRARMPLAMDLQPRDEPRYYRLSWNSTG
jgi:hypothetical protein